MGKYIDRTKLFGQRAGIVIWNGPSGYTFDQIQAMPVIDMNPAQSKWIQKILVERKRQDEKWGFPQENSYCEWGSILSEEVGELCKELNELNFRRGDLEKMETEAVQVAAVALSILEQSGVAEAVRQKISNVLNRVGQ